MFEMAERQEPDWGRTFRDRVVVIVGASGGIGATTARLFARSGAEVIACDRDTGRLERLRAELAAAGAAFEIHPLQVDEPQSVSDFAGWIGRRQDHVDHLINAAGQTSGGPSDQVLLADWERILRVNLTGTFLTCQALAPLLMEGHDSTVVNLASELAISVEPEKAAYIASKAGVIGLTKVLGVEWVSRGVRVNCVAPGATRTPMIARIENDPIIREAYLSRVPAHRFAEPEDIADGIAFLSSHLSRHMVGQVMVIDGGYTVG